MKLCKHYLLFLLAGALLLLPITSQYALDINWWKDKISQYQETLQKTMPGALVALGAAGALYYWWSKRGGDGGGGKEVKPSVEKPKETLIPEALFEHQQVPLKVVAPTLKQFQVYSQSNRDGGGAASCGYQVLLRGMQIVQAKSRDEIDADLEKTLMDSSTIAVYFGPDGEWRKDIIARRKDQELKKMLHEKFIKTLKQSCDDKAKDLYKSAFGFLEDTIVVISRDPQERIKQYEFTDESIQSDLAKSLDQLKNETNETLIEKLQSPEMIHTCFDLERMRRECLSEEFILGLSKFIEELNKRPDLQEDFAGDWLSDGELEYLWQEHRVDIIPLRINCGFKAIANFELVDNPDVPKEFDEVAVYVDEEIKPLLNKKRQMFQIFGLGTMRQTGSSTGTRGHWYPLVMYQNQNGERNYYITDSLDNRDRTKDTNAWKIINLIEKAVKEI